MQGREQSRPFLFGCHRQFNLTANPGGASKAEIGGRGRALPGETL